MLGHLSADISVSSSEQFTESVARGTENVQGQMSEHNFAPSGDYCVNYPSNLLRNARGFENWGIFSDIPQSPKNIHPRDAFRLISRE